MKKLLCFILLLFVNEVNAQYKINDSTTTFVTKHPEQIWSGNGADTFVCYKQAHRNMFFVITGLIVLVTIVAIQLPKTKCVCLDRKQAPPKVARGKEKILKPSVYRDVILKDEGLLSGRPRWEVSLYVTVICPETSHRGHCS